MSAHPECIYCTQDERIQKLMIEICKLRVSTLYLFKEQTYPGRVVVAMNEHYHEFFHMPQETQDAYMRDVAQAAAAVEKAFRPGKINYGAFGDTMPHVHFHVVPKFEDGHNWGKMFEMNLGQTYLTDEQYQDMISEIVKHL